MASWRRPQSARRRAASRLGRESPDGSGGTEAAGCVAPEREPSRFAAAAGASGGANWFAVGLEFARAANRDPASAGGSVVLAVALPAWRQAEAPGGWGGTEAKEGKQ